MASSGQQGKVGTPEDQILAGGGKQTPLRAQRDAMTLSQGTDCRYQAMSGDRNGPSVELVAPSSTRLSPEVELEAAGSELEPSSGDAQGDRFQQHPDPCSPSCCTTLASPWHPCKIPLPSTVWSLSASNAEQSRM